MKKCLLCNKETELCDSHIIPKFYFRWLKKTSATGLLRVADNPNVPFQDGFKEKLLCKICEKRFNKLETYFANKFFHPYINEYLDEYMAETDKVNPIYYDERLLKFIISIQWRILVTEKSNYITDNDKFNLILKNKISEWKDYLLEKRKDTGMGKTHMLFLRNLINGNGYLDPNISPHINTYLLRTTDGTTVRSKDKLFLFSKFGPFVFLTFLEPSNFKGFHNTLIRKKNKISPVQQLMNTEINQFLFVDRPNQCFAQYEYSEKQKQQINKRWLQNKEKSLNSTTNKVNETDIIMTKVKQVNDYA